MRLREQKIYRRGSNRLRAVYGDPAPGAEKNRLLLLLVILVALLLLFSSLIFSRVMKELRMSRQPREQPELNDRYFRQLLDCEEEPLTRESYDHSQPENGH